MLGQVACEDKSNEFTAIPELLRLLNLDGATVTIDAMGCQKEIASQIRDQKGHYVLGPKGNQPTLEVAMQTVFDAAAECDFNGVATHATSEHGHGLDERRIVQALTIPPAHAQCQVWRDLKTLVAVTSCRTLHGEENWDTRFYISSHHPRALARAVRQHWSIKNSQHHVLAVSFHEDQRRQSHRYGATNLATVRRLVLSVLRQESTRSRGVKCKRLTCALDPHYLNTVLQTLNAQPI